jgi:hypothetical protein
LDWHPIDAYLAPNGLGRYSFVKDNEIVFNEDEKLFDLVVMMDCSQCPIHPVLSQSFYQTVEKYSAIVRAHGAEPVLFMTWAYKDKPEMIKGLSEAYVRAGNVNHALVIPAGLAFSRSIAIKPELNLYVADKRHPTLAGTYLGAAVIYASLFKRSPIGNSYWAGLDSQTALHLQTVAWETVKDFYHMTGE